MDDLIPDIGDIVSEGLTRSSDIRDRLEFRFDCERPRASREGEEDCVLMRNGCRVEAVFWESDGVFVRLDSVEVLRMV